MTVPATFVAACLKWVDHRPSVDPLTGAVSTDGRTSGPSPADEAALEWALRIGEAWGLPTVAVTAGGRQADAMLADAVAAGADRALRVEMGPGVNGAGAAAGLAEVLSGAAMVVCGAWSLDGGTGSVPAFLAAHLGAAQALGLVEVRLADLDPFDLGPAGADPPVAFPSVLAVRRLDGGRRERLAVSAPAVLSVEADTARLRRSSLLGVLHDGAAVVEVHTPVAAGLPSTGTPMPGPYRPRTHALAPPAGGSARERILALTGATGPRSSGAKVVTLAPGEAADAILAALREWGYLP